MSNQDVTTEQLKTVFDISDFRTNQTTYSQDLTLLPAGSAFQIQILDNSMRDEGIRAGDLLDCERVEEIEDGHLALVKTPYGLRVRRYFDKGGMIHLQAADPTHPELFLPPSDVQIIARPLRLERWFVSFDESEVA
jgi:SOS-response transcriptional repressor LexA